MKYMSAAVLFLCLAACGGGSDSSTPDSSVSPSNPQTNQAPIANDDNVTIFVNEAKELDILGNDTDGNGDSLSIVSTTQPVAGQVSQQGGVLTYTPNENFIGSDTFSYSVSDGKGGTASAIVSITVNNAAPIAENDLIETLQSTLVEFDPLANDSSSASLELTIVTTSTPSNGQVSLQENRITYVPASGFVGQDSFAYTVRDSLGDESTASVAVSVFNLVPVAVDDAITTKQNVTLLISVLDNDVDAIGDVLTVSGSTLPDNGAITLQDNVFTYIPNDGFSGVDSFQYSIVDNFGAVTEGNVNIEVINVVPTVGQDSATALVNSQVEIDVLSNDTDVTGDTLTILTVSTPLQGTASIVDNKILYQPNADYAGEDLFGYTVEDSYGASVSGFVNIEVVSGIFVHGKVIGLPQADLEVTFSYGEKQTMVTTNAQGEYQVLIGAENLEAVVSAAVEHPSASYTMKAYFDDLGSLIAEAGSDFSVSQKNISDMTSAEVALLSALNGNTEVTTLKDLYGLRAQLVTTYQLELAVAASLIYQANSITLPSGFSSINALMMSPFTMRQQLSLWREQYPTEYYQAFEHIFENDELSSAPDALEDGNTVFQESATVGLKFSSDALALNINNQGHYLSGGLYKGEFSWSRAETTLDIEFLEPFEVFRFRNIYCGSNVAQRQITFNATNMQYRHLYSSALYDVFMLKNIGAHADSNCVDASIHTTEYRAIKRYKKAALEVEPGSFYMESFRLSNVAEGQDGQAFHRVSALFELNDDGTFNEKIDDVTGQRNGLWHVENDTLHFDYLNGRVISYNQIQGFEDFPVWSYQTVDGNAVEAAGHTYMVSKDDDFVLDKTDGKYANVHNSLFDSTISGLFRIDFEADNTGGQSSFTNNEWSSSNRSLHTWSLSNNRYIAEYYYDLQLDENVKFCDDSLTSCHKWRYRSFEVIGKIDNDYIIKVYQEFYESESTPNQTRSGYIGLFSFESN